VNAANETRDWRSQRNRTQIPTRFGEQFPHALRAYTLDVRIGRIVVNKIVPQNGPAGPPGKARLKAVPPTAEVNDANTPAEVPVQALSKCGIVSPRA
jgi:hypothetical protein